MEAPSFLYELETPSRYVPSRWAGSPWSPTMQHGGPVIGIFAREAEIAARSIDMRVSRLTVDLFKAVPMETIRAETRFVRRGGRVAGLETLLRAGDGDSPVSRASALLLRPEPHDGRRWETPESPAPPPEECASTAHPGSGSIELPPGFHDKVEIRSGVDDAGPFAWITTGLDLVRGEEITPLQRASALTDMTLGSQMRLALRRRDDARPGDPVPQTGGLMINTDTTVYWERPCTGEWLCLRPSLISEHDGIGTAEAILYDVDGRVGRSLQSALLQRLPT